MIRMNIDSKLSITNPYWAFKFITYFLKTFLPFALLVTGIMLTFIKKTKSRVSNSYAESHMRVYKHNIVPHQHGNLIGELARAVAKYSSMVVVEQKLKIGAKSRIRIVQKPLYPEAASDPFLTEK